MFLQCIALSGNGFVYNDVTYNDVTYNDVTRMLTVRRPEAFKLYFPFLLSSF